MIKISQYSLFHFARAQSGATAVFFALLLIPVLGMVGLAVDSARAFAVRAQLQQSLDAAALAGGRMYTSTSRTTYIQNFFSRNWKSEPYNATASALTITDNPSTGRLTVAATASMPTVFMRLLGINTVAVSTSAEIVRNENTLEVALAIDTTGSMNSNDSAGNHKMTAAKNAANLLLNILYSNQDSDEDVFVSVVPFVQNVNVGNNYSSWLVAGSESAIPWNSGPFPANGWRGCMVERLNATSGQLVYDTTEEPPSLQRFMPYADYYFGPNCPSWTSNERGITPGICRNSNDKVYMATSSGVSGSSAPSHSTGSASDGAVTWSYIRPAYSTDPGYNAPACPLWRRGEAVTTGACRTAPICPAWASGQSISIGDCRLNANGLPYTAASAGTTSGSSAPTHTSGTSTSGGISWTYRAICANWASGQSISTGNCRVNGGRLYVATSSGTTSGSTGPTHTSGTSSSGGISWMATPKLFSGIGGYMYTATNSGTTGNLSPVHLSGSASDGTVNWSLYRRFWISGEDVAIASTSYMRNNPWYMQYDPRTRATSTGSTAPTHTSGTSTVGGVDWRYQNDLTSQVTGGGQYGAGYNSGCGTPIVPMTNNRLTAKATVDVLAPSTSYGGTMTPMGLMWAWRTISPQWRGLWSGVPTDRPYNYNTEDNFKAVIILTDGDNVFNSCSGDAFCRGSSTPYGYLADGRLGSTDSATAEAAVDGKVTTVCDHIRATGTSIYAVMFDLPAGSSATRTLFTNCVGDPTHFFDAANQTELEDAFREIALDLTRLRVSQ